jgi:hypothetical protein
MPLCLPLKGLWQPYEEVEVVDVAVEQDQKLEEEESSNPRNQ